MNKFVEYANLPHDVRQLVIGEKYRKLLDKSLKTLDIEPVYCPSNPYIDERLSGHADLSVLHAGGNIMFLAPYLKGSRFGDIIEETGLNTIFPEVKMSKYYPNDSCFNLCILNKSCFYAPKVSENNIVKYLIIEELKPIAVKQGYCRCSVCIVDKSSIITADRGIYSKAKENDINCLLISPGYIALDGYDYGFIGGCSFKISDNKICFTGTLDAHPDNQKILAFLDSKGVEPFFMTNLPVFDIGSAVPLTEK